MLPKINNKKKHIQPTQGFLQKVKILCNNANQTKYRKITHTNVTIRRLEANNNIFIQQSIQHRIEWNEKDRYEEVRKESACVWVVVRGMCGYFGYHSHRHKPIVKLWLLFNCIQFEGFDQKLAL